MNGGYAAAKGWGGRGGLPSVRLQAVRRLHGECLYAFALPVLAAWSGLTGVAERSLETPLYNISVERCAELYG